MVGLTDAGVSGSGLIFDGLDRVGRVGSYVFDSLAAGAGLVAIAFGKITESVFTLASDLDEVILKAAKFLKGTGIEAPAWLTQAIEGDKLLSVAVRNFTTFAVMAPS